MDGQPSTLPALRDAAVTAQVHVRWDVKTGGDQDAGKIDQKTVKPTTIQTLGAAKAPAAWPPSGRVAPQETTIWQLDGTLTAYKHENDGDYHLVLSDVEIPDPAQVVPNSLFKAQIQNARNAFDAKHSQQLAALDAVPKTANASAPMIVHVSEPVTVTGIGFVDFAHGATGAAPNCIELHPVLSIQFKA